MKMSIVWRVLFVFLASTFIFACKDDEDVAFDVTIPVTYTVDETATSSIGKSFSIPGTLNALDNAQVTKYKDKIKNVYITKINYSISDVTVSTTTNLSRIDVMLKGSLDPVASETSSQVLATKTDTEMTEYNDFEFAKLADQIKYNQTAQASIVTSVSKTPVKFTITLKVTFKVVASN
jgi:hypothetical protein